MPFWFMTEELLDELESLLAEGIGERFGFFGGEKRSWASSEIEP